MEEFWKMIVPAVVEAAPNLKAPATCKRDAGEAVPMPTLPEALTTIKEVPEEEATLKGSRVVVPWTLNDTVADVAFTPATVPLSKRVPSVKVLVPFHLATFPKAPLPMPVKRLLGKLMTKELAVEVETLNTEEEEVVETFMTT